MLSQSVIATHDGSKYLQQLAKHWQHKMPALTFDSHQAHIPFQNGAILNMLATDENLQIAITSLDPEMAERMEEVFERHIQRFAFRAPLDITWKRSD